MSKGSKPRPLGVSREQFESNWDRVFLKEVPEVPEETPEHDNPAEGGMWPPPQPFEYQHQSGDLWVHNCTMERFLFERGGHGDNYIATAKGYPCNWCGKQEGET